MAADRPRSLDRDLRTLARAARRSALFCDFDGCLAPIVDDPEQARATPGASAVLARLAERFALVAVVSGRPVSYLSRRVRARGVRLVGLYGIEQRSDGVRTVVPEAERYAPAADRAAAELRAVLPETSGVYVEHKGLAIAVHFRRAAQPDEQMQEWEPVVLDVAERTGLRSVLRGKLVLELRPPVRSDKGIAIRRLVAEHGIAGALVVGDDTGDIPAFKAVEGLDPAVRIAVASAEAPRALVASADHVVDGPRSFVAVLRSLADATGT